MRDNYRLTQVTMKRLLLLLLFTTVTTVALPPIDPPTVVGRLTYTVEVHGTTGFITVLEASSDRGVTWGIVASFDGTYLYSEPVAGSVRLFRARTLLP